MLAHNAMSILALRGDQEAFSQLLTMNPHGASASARRPATWPPLVLDQVADLTGVSKQAAWSRWRLWPDRHDVQCGSPHQIQPEKTSWRMHK